MNGQAKGPMRGWWGGNLTGSLGPSCGQCNDQILAVVLYCSMFCRLRFRMTSGCCGFLIVKERLSCAMIFLIRIQVGKKEQFG